MGKQFTHLHTPVYVNTSGEPTMNVGSGLSISAHDYISVNYFDITTEIYTFKTGGASGVTVATLTVVYTDSTKSLLSTVTKT